MATNNKPATTLRRGIVQATIWEKTSKNGPFFSTTFSRSYKERSGKWSSSMLMQKAGAFEVLSKNDSVTELYGAIQRAVASNQPILILEDVPTSEKCPAAQSEESSLPNPKDESPVRKSKQATET